MSSFYVFDLLQRSKMCLDLVKSHLPSETFLMNETSVINSASVIKKLSQLQFINWREKVFAPSVYEEHFNNEQLSSVKGALFSKLRSVPPFLILANAGACREFSFMQIATLIVTFVY